MLFIAGAAAIIYLIYSGILYITAAGNPATALTAPSENVPSAENCCVWPTFIVAVEGATAIEESVTGGWVDLDVMNAVRGASTLPARSVE